MFVFCMIFCFLGEKVNVTSGILSCMILIKQNGECYSDLEFPNKMKCCVQFREEQGFWKPSRAPEGILVDLIACAMIQRRPPG